MYKDYFEPKFDWFSCILINPYTFNFNCQFNYSIPFSICHNTTKWKEFFSLKGLLLYMFLALIGW
jgi:hypothetical protein